ncbi:MAG: amidophosphoribosyltransferase, partial [Muribaculaceae bacterium]|nr:amidophosphoribosyltransferase [Muribaculaceae bacterium]
YIIDEVYNQCKRSLEGLQRKKNYVRMIYSPFSEKEISKEISRLITPCNSKARIKVVFLKLEDLRKAIPGHSGDWCFSGNYPTSGAYTKICQAYVNWYEGINKR